MMDRPAYRINLSLSLLLMLFVFTILYFSCDISRYHLDGNDSYQYLSESNNFIHNKGLSSSLLHYDENLVSGSIPAPQTVFPPGYSIAIASLESLGVDGERAGVVVSLAAFVSTVVSLMYSGYLLGVQANAQRFVLFLWICNGIAWSYALRIYSESLFTAITFVGITLLIKAETLETRPRFRLAYLVAGCCVSSLAYWVRYAGCLLIAAVLLYFFTKWLAIRTWARFRDLAISTIVMAIVALPLWLRNAYLVGTVRGGNAKLVSKPFSTIAQQVIFDWVQLTSGMISSTTPTSPLIRVCRILLLICILSIFVMLVPRFVRCIRSSMNDSRIHPYILIFIYILVYFIGLSYIGKITAINLEGPRMFLPICPIVLLGISCLFPTGESNPPRRGHLRVFTAVLAITTVLYCVCQWYGFVAANRGGAHEIMHQRLAETVVQVDEVASESPMSLQDWIQTHVPKDAVLMAADGQAWGFVLQRGCLTPPCLEYSSRVWDETETRAVATKYHIDYLFLFPGSESTERLARESPFFARLVSKEPLSWLKPAAKTRSCLVYRIQDPMRNREP